MKHSKQVMRRHLLCRSIDFHSDRVTHEIIQNKISLLYWWHDTSLEYSILSEKKILCLQVKSSAGIFEKMDNNNDPNRGLSAFARLAIGAGVAAGVGLAAYKLFNQNDQQTPRSYEASGSTNRFVPNRKVIVVRKMGECKQAINMLKAYVCSTWFSLENLNNTINNCFN